MGHSSFKNRFSICATERVALVPLKAHRKMQTMKQQANKMESSKKDRVVCVWGDKAN